MSKQSPESDNTPVYYCKTCHSLCVVMDESLANEHWDGSYCGKCYSADIGVCSFDEWYAEEERRRKKLEEIEWNK